MGIETQHNRRKIELIFMVLFSFKYGAFKKERENLDYD
jgi:hypothetical protein